MSKVTDTRKGKKVEGKLGKSEEAFWEELSIEFAARRFYMLGYSASDIKNYHSATSKNFERNAKSWNKRNSDKTPKFFGDELMNLIPCKCQDMEAIVNGKTEERHIECPPCNLKRLRDEEDKNVIEERKAIVRAGRKK